MSDEQPPVFSSWRTWYILVLAVMIAQVVLYGLITRYFL